MSALNSPTRNQRAHSACLSDWLTMGSAKDFVRCKAYADAGVVPMTLFVSNHAHLALTHRSWATDWADETAELLGHYIDRGIVKLDAPLHMPQAGCSDWEHNGLLPLQIAMVCRQARAAAVLIAKGALEVTDFRALQSPASVTVSPPPAAESREAAFERWLLMLWPAREDIRAMLTKAAMNRRIAVGSVLAPGAVSDIPEAVAPARRRRTV